MMAANCSNLQIQAALRWASAEALELYAITSEDAYGGWLLEAERVRLTATMAHHLPRALPVYDGDDAAAALYNGCHALNAEAAAADT